MYLRNLKLAVVSVSGLLLAPNALADCAYWPGEVIDAKTKARFGVETVYGNGLNVELVAS